MLERLCFFPSVHWHLLLQFYLSPSAPTAGRLGGPQTSQDLLMSSCYPFRTVWKPQVNDTEHDSANPNWISHGRGIRECLKDLKASCRFVLCLAAFGWWLLVYDHVRLEYSIGIQSNSFCSAITVAELLLPDCGCLERSLHNVSIKRKRRMPRHASPP